MLLTYLFTGYCVLAVFGPGLSSATPVTTNQPEKSPKYVVYQEKKTWDDARDFCDEKDMALAYIMTYEEQKDLREFIVESNLLPKDEKSGYWLGARAEDKIWRWEYNEENPRDDHFMAGWHWYKPNYKVKQDGEVQECMELQYINTSIFTRSLSWNDLWCSEKRGFICQVLAPTDKEDW